MRVLGDAVDVILVTPTWGIDSPILNESVPPNDWHIHTEKCLVGYTIKWLIQLHDLVSYKVTTFLVAVTISDS